MKKLLLAAAVCFGMAAYAQSNIDTLAFQDFEVTPAAPVWSFTGPVIYNSGFSAPGATPANSPLGIGGSRAWETTQNSGGLILDFANTIIPAGYDSVRVRFNLAAMNLLGSGGGPDNLDYVLVAYSLDGGTTYSNRVRVRGGTTDNTTWPYSATGIAKVNYQPATETVFQPTSSGPQIAQGYSTVEIVFPGTVTQIAMRITGRSSSSTDTWLVDNLVMTGENNCINTTATINTTACNTYTAPSGAVFNTSGTYIDVIGNAEGCDSTITINLTINSTSTSTIAASGCGSYTLPSGTVVTSSGNYMDTIPNATGCDSVITANITIHSATTGTLIASSCTGNYTLPGGSIVTASGTYMDTIPNAMGCDSVITATITVDSNTTAYYSPSVCFSLTMPSGAVVTTSGIYNDTIPNAAGCDSITTWDVFIYHVDTTTTLNGATITSNAVFASYQWIDCNNGNAIIPGETNQSFLPAVNGDYAVIVMQGFCTDTSACVNVMSVGIQAAHASTIEVYPNPATDVLNIQGAGAGSVIIITDVQGRQVATHTAAGGMSTVNVAELSAGSYIVEVMSAGGIFRTRFIKN